MSSTPKKESIEEAIEPTVQASKAKEIDRLPIEFSGIGEASTARIEVRATKL